MTYPFFSTIVIVTKFQKFMRVTYPIDQLITFIINKNCHPHTFFIAFSNPRNRLDELYNATLRNATVKSFRSL